ncbi:HalOD1 output domain-containing protein [Natrialbaceae archaeon A-CW3]
MASSDNTTESQNSQRFKIGDRSPSLAVIESVARFRDTDPLSLAPLRYYTDPDALDQLLTNDTVGAVQFTYDEVEVEIASSGEIAVAESTA